MKKRSNIKSRLLSVAFWSIVSAAFIGPGTVTTAAKAGASFEMALLWALLFSIIATIFLQETSARITLGSGKSLGKIIDELYPVNSKALKIVLFVTVAFGCTAYEAGNMLGAIAGIDLFYELPLWMSTAMVLVISCALLYIGDFKSIANLLGLVVAFMGITFLIVAWNTPLTINAWSKGIVPGFPDNSLLLAIGLVGTTIVPYNLFLASGIKPDQTINEMRWGLIGAILIGGLISIAIMVVGTQLDGASFSFVALSDTLENNIGKWGGFLFGIGLFAAGLSSSITAPLAAAITGKSLFNWAENTIYFRAIWFLILLVGYVFSLLNFKPIPVIIMAQAINGLLLPVVTIFLVITVNNQRLLGEYATRSWAVNLILLLIVGITCYLGLNSLYQACTKFIPGLSQWSPNQVRFGFLLIIFGLLAWIIRKLVQQSTMSNEY